MALLNRNQILAAPDQSAGLTTIEVPEWGGEVSIRVMTGRERDRFETAFSKDPGNNLRARLVALCVADEAGRPIFTEVDVQALGEKNANALHRVFEAALKANSIGKKDVAEVEKNSGAAT